MESEGPPQEQPMEYITDVHKNYEPTDLDLFISVPSGDYQRLIWAEPNELREREIQKWQEFMDFIKENNLEALPEFYTD